MAKDENTFKHSIYTDLALESAETYADGGGAIKIEGVEIEESVDGDAKVTWVKIVDKRGAKALGKPIGNYVTIESDAMKNGDVDEHERIIKILAETLIKLKIEEKGDILVVGLGNSHVTPDALGPRVVSKIFVTRHIMKELPTEAGGAVRPVSAVSPGVMGTTGIETRDIIKGICEQAKPALVIAIDALAARKTNRVNATIQLSDTGVAPGTGMSAKAESSPKSIDKHFLGVPVIAIGVPTVVDAATLVSDTMDLMLDDMVKEAGADSQFYAMLKSLEEREKYSLVRRVLEPYAGNMFVTPKEVDAVIDRLSNIIANAVNIAAQPSLDVEDINRFMY